MKINNRTIIGIILMIETLIMFLLTMYLWNDIFGTEHIAEWEGEDESVALFSIFFCLYLGFLSLIGVIGMLSYFIKGKIWKFITKVLTLNIIAVFTLYSLGLLTNSFVFGFIGITLSGLLIWGFCKLHAICKLC